MLGCFAVAYESAIPMEVRKGEGRFRVFSFFLSRRSFPVSDSRGGAFKFLFLLDDKASLYQAAHRSAIYAIFHLGKKLF